jgi:hypothetical protein
LLIWWHRGGVFVRVDKSSLANLPPKLWEFF